MTDISECLLYQQENILPRRCNYSSGTPVHSPATGARHLRRCSWYARGKYRSRRERKDLPSFVVRAAGERPEASLAPGGCLGACSCYVADLPTAVALLSATAGPCNYGRIVGAFPRLKQVSDGNRKQDKADRLTRCPSLPHL